MVDTKNYEISGSYYEACNCDAICPCRRINGEAGGRSTYGQCDFLLNWNITDGHFGDTNLSGCAVCMAGRFVDDEPGCPWTVIIYISKSATPEQFDALSNIFQGHAGGNIGFTGNITRVLRVKPADIHFSHESSSEFVRVNASASASVNRAVGFDGVVSCGIPGHDFPGTESVSSLKIDEPGLAFAYEERCGFATRFAYAN